MAAQHVRQDGVDAIDGKLMIAKCQTTSHRLPLSAPTTQGAGQLLLPPFKRQQRI